MELRCDACGTTISLPPGATPASLTCPNCGKAIDVHAVQTIPIEPQAPTSMSENQIFPPGTIIGQYRILELVGQGGMGAVYRAEHVELGRIVALKVLPSRFAQDPKFVERFRREAKVLARLQHPHIVQVFDMGVQGEIYYFIMEFVEGVTLRQILSKKMLSPAQALHIVPKLCDALEYAHSKGIIHRDIKPENILMDKSGEPKIADFGLAKIVKGETVTGSPTHTNLIMGTPDYMAPEQRESARMVDHRADIYSMGVVLYEMLTGQLPLGRFDPPSKKIQIDLRIDEVVLKALDSEPERRYQRASHMGKDVAEVRAVGAPAAVPAAVESQLRELRENAPDLPLLLPMVNLVTLGHAVVFSLFDVFNWLGRVTRSLRSLDHRVPADKRDDWEDIEHARMPARKLWWLLPLWIGLLAAIVGMYFLIKGDFRHWDSLRYSDLGIGLLISGLYVFGLTVHILYLVFLVSVRSAVREIIDRVELLGTTRSEWTQLRMDCTWTFWRIVGHGLLIAFSLILIPLSAGTVALLLYPLLLCLFWNSRVASIKKLLRAAGTTGESVTVAPRRETVYPTPAPVPAATSMPPTTDSSWWSKLKTRDQVLLILGAVFLALAFVGMGSLRHDAGLGRFLTVAGIFGVLGCGTALMMKEGAVRSAVMGMISTLTSRQKWRLLGEFVIIIAAMWVFFFLDANSAVSALIWTVFLGMVIALELLRGHMKTKGHEDPKADSVRRVAEELDQEVKRRQAEKPKKIGLPLAILCCSMSAVLSVVGATVLRQLSRHPQAEQVPVPLKTHSPAAKSFGEFLDAGKLGGLTVEEFRDKIGSLRGTRVRWTLRVFNQEIRLGGYTDPETLQRVDQPTYNELFMLESIPPGSSYLQIPEQHRVLVRCLEGFGTGLHSAPRGSRVVVEGTLWGADPEGGWKTIYLKDFSIRTIER